MDKRRVIILAAHPWVSSCTTPVRAEIQSFFAMQKSVEFLKSDRMTNGQKRRVAAGHKLLPSLTQHNTTQHNTT